MKSASIFLLAIVIIMWVLFIGMLTFGYFFLKAVRKKRLDKEKESGISNQEEAPIVVQLLLFIAFLALLFLVVKYFRKIHYPVNLIVAAPLVTLYKIRKKPELDAFIFLTCFAVFLGLFFSYILIGLPPKQPVLIIDGTEIVMGKTTLGEMQDKGKGFQLQFVSSTDVEEKYALFKGETYIANAFFQSNHAEKDTVKIIYIDGEKVGYLDELKISIDSKEINLLQDIDQSDVKESFSDASYFTYDSQEKTMKYNVKYESTPNTSFWISTDIEIHTTDDKKLRSIQLVGK